MADSKKLTYAARAERYAKEAAANKSASFPVPVSQAYAKWLLYKEQHCYRPENLNLVCKLLENTPPVIGGEEIPQLLDWQCALLSWPLVFVDAKGNRVVNELNFIAPKGTEIRMEIAGLMLAELADPFRYRHTKLSGNHASAMVLAAPGVNLVHAELYRKAQLILKKNPEFAQRFAIKSTQQHIKSKKNGASIKQRTLWFRTSFAKSPITFVYADSAGILSDDTPISTIRAKLKLCKANHLFITAGTPGRERPSALNPIRDEARRWLSNKNELGSRVGLLYQAEETDSFDDFQVWKRVYPGYPEARLSAIFENALRESKSDPVLYERMLLAKMDSDKLVPRKKKKARPRKRHQPINTSLISCSTWNFQRLASKKVTHADRAKRYAKKCAGKEIDVPKPVSESYKKWLDYTKKHEFKEEYLTRVCTLIENALQATEESKHLELSDRACAFLSWPLVFVDDKGGRVINELHFRARPKIDISVLMAGLMLAEIVSPFRNRYRGGILNCPAPVILAAGATKRRAQPLFDKAQLILSCNPEFRDSYGIPDLKSRIESEKSGGVIRPFSIKSKAFAHIEETAIFLDDFVLDRDARPISKARFEMPGNQNSNFLIVTNGVEASVPLHASESAIAEIERRNRKEPAVYGRVDLIY